MSTQGQGDVVARLEARERTYLDRGGLHYYMLEDAAIDAEAREEITRLRTLLSSSRGEQAWRTPDELPELKDGDRFAVYLAFDTGDVKLADWVAWTEHASEYHASTGVYLGQYPQDGDALYMTDDGFDVRKGDDGRWVSHKHHEDGSKTPFYVTAWIEALRPLPSAPGSVPTSTEPDETQILADGVAAEVAEGSGSWRSCSGCYDTEDGHPTQRYPHSKIFGCDLGNGCSECGGLGVVWDDTDYEDMARHMLSEKSEAVPTSLAGQVPDGYVLVPKEPTDAMIDAGSRACDEFCRHGGYEQGHVYRAMLSAAPQPTAGGDAPTPGTAGEGQ